MASFIWFLSVVFYAKFKCAESTDKLVSLDCQGEIHGVYGEDSLLNCSVKSSGDTVKIIMVSWWRTGENTPLFVVSNGKIMQRKDQRFSLAHPGSSIDVSFLVKNTKRTDEGKYQCQVITDSGEDQSVISLYVTATYSKPDMSSVPEKDIVEDTEITLFCSASGGYPVGMVHWYDTFGTNWTRSAVTTVEKTTDKRINLSSKYTLRAASSYPTYRCSVLNSKGVEEGKAELHLPFRERSVKATDPEKVAGSQSSTAIAATVVVLGSLLCGLAILTLFRRRRSQRDMYAAHSDMTEEGSPGLNTKMESVSEPLKI